MAIKKQIVIKWMLGTLWVLIGAGTIVLLIAAMQKKDAEHCKGVYINIKGVNNNFFVDKSDILNSIKTILGSEPKGHPVKSFDLNKMEAELDKNIWVRSAEMFFDNNEMLRVNVEEREPVARVFTANGETFYIDSSIMVLPLSDKFSARLPVFTNFPLRGNRLSKADSNLLRDIKTVSMAIQKDSFRMAMIDQIDINAQRNFDMLPKIGDQLIVFGDTTDVEAKFDKLKLFYKEVMMKAGWNYYSTINVQYKGQVVARRKAAGEVKADSLETMRLMKLIAANAEKMSSDSLFRMIAKENIQHADTSMILLSLERDDEGSEASNSIEKTKPQEAIVVKTGITAKPVTVTKKPDPLPMKKTTVKPATTKPPVKKSNPVKPAATQKTVAKPVVKTAVKPAVKSTTPVKPKTSKPNNDY